MEQAFGAPLSNNMLSQFVLAFNKMIQLAQNRHEFDKFVANEYGGAVHGAEAEDLFTAYFRISLENQTYTSKSNVNAKKQKRRARGPRASQHPTPQDDTDSEDARLHPFRPPPGLRTLLHEDADDERQEEENA